MTTHDAREARRVDAQRALDLARDAAARNRWGQFATPPALADAIVRRCVLPHAPTSGALRVLEPSLGTGAFVTALRRALPPSLTLDVRGVELDPRVARAARALWRGADVSVREGDFTRLDPPRGWRADLVVANPPYVRHHHLDAEEKRRLRARTLAQTGLAVSGLAGLYVHFVAQSLAWMREDALGAWLVPAEWMDVNYGDALRAALATRVELLGVHRFREADVQFGDALVSSSVVWFRKAAPREGAVCVMTTGSSLEAPVTAREVPVASLASCGKWGTRFAGGDVTSAPEGRVRLGDLVTVSRGLATGANGFFVRTRAAWRALGVPETLLRPVVPSSRYLEGSVIEADDDGWPRLEPQRAVLACSLDEATVARDHPALWAVLASDAARAVRAGYLCRARTPWYAQERRDEAPILATYMARGRRGAKPFRFFWNRSRALATNAWLLLRPVAALAARPALVGELAAHLGSLDAAALTGHGRVYGGGLFKLEPRELAALDVTTWADARGLGAR